VHKDKPKACP